MALVLDLYFLSVLTAAATQVGSQLKPVLARLQLGVHTQEDLPPPLPLPVLAALFEGLEQNAQRGRFVFAFATLFNFDHLPAVAAFLHSAQNLRSLHRFFGWLPDLVHPNLRLDIATDRAGVLYPRVVSDQARWQDHPLLIELMAAVVSHTSQSLAPDLAIFEAIHFRHAPQGSVADYAAHFPCPVRFEQPQNALIGHAALIDHPLPGSLPVAQAAAEARITVQLLGDGVVAPLPLRLEQWFRQDLTRLTLSQEDVARAHHLHPRQLQRALQAHAISVSELKQRIRQEWAIRWLRDTPIDIDTIALKLGFQERRSFTTAFKSWQGCTPQQYRQRSRQERVAS